MASKKANKKKQYKKISIIIPAYNEEGYISRTLDSILQSMKYHPVGEVIVVANACTDSTNKIVNKYKSDGIRLFITKKKGVSHAKNLGAKKASSDILVFLDADTSISKKAIKRIAALSEKYDFGSLWVKPFPMNIKSKFFMSLKNIVFAWGVYLGTNGILFCNVEIFNKVGGFKDTLKKREDKDFVYSAIKHGKYRYIKSVYVETSMRRFEKKGYFWVIKYWVVNWVKEKLGKNNSEYPSIR